MREAQCQDLAALGARDRSKALSRLAREILASAPDASERLSNQQQPGCVNVNSCCVDVRDVADLHLRAMTDPKANGERFLASSGASMWMVEIARLPRPICSLSLSFRC